MAKRKYGCYVAKRSSFEKQLILVDYPSPIEEVALLLHRHYNPGESAYRDLFKSGDPIDLPVDIDSGNDYQHKIKIML